MTAVAGVRYWWDGSGFVAPGRETLPFDAAPSRYSATNTPWMLRPGESHLDNIPAGVPVVRASDYTSSRDLYTVLTLLDDTLTTASYVQLDSGVYWINKFANYGGNIYRGWTTLKRKVMGIIGVDRVLGTGGSVVTETIVRLHKDAIANSDPYNGVSLVDQVKAVTGSTGPRPTVLFSDNSTSSTPMFVSGITFQGTMQEPFSVYSSATQAYFRMNQTVASPLLYFGMSIWYCLPGSRWQFNRFQGFGFAFNSEPPGEAGCVNSNRSVNLVVSRNEFDGRVSADIDPAQPRSSGGWMLNKEQDVTIIDCWQHHTRRSGNAYNTNTYPAVEKFRQINYQCEYIADQPDDGWAGGWGFFNGSNVEEFISNYAEYTNCRFNVASGSHIAWAVPGKSSGSGAAIPAPSNLVFKVTGFTTDDTLYGGCLRIGTSRNPNSSGDSAVWLAINADIAYCDTVFDIRTSDGTRLAPVKKANYNASIHKPDTHYVLTSF